MEQGCLAGDMEQLFERARKAWNSLDGFRSRRNRCKRYVFGRQWCDSIEIDGRIATEKELIEEMGQKPMQNNLLRRIIRNVTGVYRANYKIPAPGEDLTGAAAEEANRNLSAIFCANRMEELTPRILEEFLISGMAVVKFSGGDAGFRKNTRILPVTPDNFFFHSDGYDPRGWDVDLIGEVHNVAYASLMRHLCRTAADIERFDAIFDSCRRSGLPCRATEVWYRDTEVCGYLHDERHSRLRRLSPGELRAEMTRQGAGDASIRSHYRQVWRCAWFSHDGTLLKTGPAAERHPYVWKAYPFLDGEVHSYVHDLIDQQRYVNHLITLYDFIMRSSAKGVLLFPDESIPRGWSLQEVADQWSRFNGVIPFRAQPGVPLPTQVSGNAANIGIAELLKIEMQMLEDISGVSPTLQGKLGNTATTSGTLFAQQNQAAMTSLLDVIRSFEEFVAAIARFSIKTPDSRG